MTTALTPPPAPQAPPAPASPPPRSSSRVIAILAVALGVAVVVGTVVGAATSTVSAASIQTSARTLEVAGVDDLNVELSAGSLRIEFADVDEAELQVTSSAIGADQWTLDRVGTQLRVASPQWQFGFPWATRGSGDAVLRLPESLAGLDASLGLSAGELTADGEFSDVALDVGAGRAELTGTARALTVEVSAGRADVDIEDSRTAALSVSAGQLVGVLGGNAPDAVTIEVSAGSLTLDVPTGTYEVTSDVSAGEFDNRIGSRPGSTHTIDVRVSAGHVVLRAG